MSAAEILTDPPTPPLDCEGCGREAVVVINGKGWCVDCLHACGSCCSGE